MFQLTDVAGPIPTLELADAGASSRARIAPGRGGMLIGLFAHGREWLYLDEKTFLDPAQNVRGGMPVLFPSPGQLEGDRFGRDGRSGAMKQHGFARTQPWREVARGTDGSAWVELELTDTDATRAQFPWPFRTTLRYALAGATLRISIGVENPGSARLPFAYGFHPYFAVSQAEKASTKVPTRATRAWDKVQKREVAFTGLDLAAGEVDMHLEDHGGSEARLQTPHGTIALVGSPGFWRWVIWTQPGKEFVCLEPWTAPGNALNLGRSLLELAPGGRTQLELAISVER